MRQGLEDLLQLLESVDSSDGLTSLALGDGFQSPQELGACVGIRVDTFEVASFHLDKNRVSHVKIGQIERTAYLVITLKLFHGKLRRQMFLKLQLMKQGCDQKRDVKVEKLGCPLNFKLA